MYFVRIDYLYKGSPVQRERSLVSSMTFVRRAIARYCTEDYLVLSVRVEKCV